MTGPSCAGKSSVKKNLHAKMLGSYEVSFDTLKWGLSGYNRETDGSTIRDLLIGYIELVAQKGLSIISESPFKTEEEYTKISRVLAAYEYKPVVVRIAAPRDILIDRFRQRLANYQEKGGKMSVTSESLFIQNMDEPRYFNPDNAWSFDSSVQTAEEVADEIIQRTLSL